MHEMDVFYMALDQVVTSLKEEISKANFVRPSGRVLQLLENKITAEFPKAKLGEIFEIKEPQNNKRTLAKVISVDRHQCILYPFDKLSGFSSEAIIQPYMNTLEVQCSNDLLGRVVDYTCTPIDRLGNREARSASIKKAYEPSPINPMDRVPIQQSLSTGIRSIDGFLTLGKGQRVGLFGQAGLGKSMLLANISKHTNADVIIYATIGERGRELKEFLDLHLPQESRSKCICVASTSDTPALQRVYAAKAALSLAEFFREQGKDVLLLFDSVTRYARALREIALTSGEEILSGTMTSSIFTELPLLTERCGNLGTGSITAIFSVLVESENDLIAKEIKSLTDGHIILDHELAARGHYPCINIATSISRIMHNVVKNDHMKHVQHLKSLMKAYEEIELLVQVGEYQKGTDQTSDEALYKIQKINNLLKQNINEYEKFEHTLKLIEDITHENIPTENTETEAS